MTDQPNYQQHTPPPEKDPEEYTYVERRAEIFEMIERQGGYRNLNRSQRELGDRYGVVHRTIQKDINRILEWKHEHLGEHTESELSIVQGRGVQDFLQAAKNHRDQERYEEAAECMAKAYELASDHLEDLQEAGVKDKAPDKTEVEHSGGLDNTNTIELDSETAAALRSAEMKALDNNGE